MLSTSGGNRGFWPASGYSLMMMMMMMMYTMITCDLFNIVFLEKEEEPSCRDLIRALRSSMPSVIK